VFPAAGCALYAFESLLQDLFSNDFKALEQLQNQKNKPPNRFPDQRTEALRVARRALYATPIFWQQLIQSNLLSLDSGKLTLRQTKNHQNLISSNTQYIDTGDTTKTLKIPSTLSTKPD